MPCARTPLQSIISSILFRTHDSLLQLYDATPLDSSPGSVPEVSPDQSREHYTSTSPQDRGRDHGGHAEASTTPREPDNTPRYESPSRLRDVGGAVTHVDTLMQDEEVQSIFHVQKHKRDWASLSHCEFDLPAVQMTAGDSGTSNDSMMEVEEETSVPALGANLQVLSTVDIDCTGNRDMEEEEEPTTAIQGVQAPQTPSTPGGERYVY